MLHALARFLGSYIPSSASRLVADMGLGALLVRSDGSVLRASPIALALFRLPNASPEGLRLETLLPGHVRAISVPAGLPLQMKARRLDGLEFPAGAARTQCKPLWRDEHIVIVTDESARVAAEQRARDAADMQRSVFDASDDKIAIRDATGRFLAGNRASEQWFGVGPGELVGKRITEIVGSARASGILALDAEVFHTGRPMRSQNLVERANGGHWHDVMRYPVFGDDGRVRSVISIGRDTNDQRQAAEALDAAKKHAERSSAERARFLSAASHDLRQPIQSIGLTAAILDGESLSPSGQKALKQIHDGVAAMRTLVDALMDIHQIQEGVARAVMADFPIESVLREVEAAVRPAAEAKGLTLTVDAGMVSVRSDRARLTQMLLNMAQNAVRYTLQGKVTIAATSSEAVVRLSVRDTGVGIAESHLPRIWDEFYQVGGRIEAGEHSRKEPGGLGLGLSIVARLSNLLEHPVEVASIEGIGSTFTILLPRSDTDAVVTAEPQDVPQVAPALHADSPTVLVVDDDPMVLQAVSGFLGAAGYRVAAFDNELEAEASIADGFPDAVVVDYRLREGRTGLALIERIRQEAEHEVPCVVLTGEIDQNVAQQVRDRGLVLLQKPVAGSLLISQLRRVIDWQKENSGD